MRTPAFARTILGTLLLSAVVFSGGCDKTGRPPKDIRKIRPSAIFNPIGFATDYLLSKVIDGIWDDVTGTPDVNELDERLAGVEARLAEHDAALGQRVGELRNEINGKTTKAEYMKLAEATLEDLKTRVAKLESRVDKIEADNEAKRKHQEELIKRLKKNIDEN